MHAGMNALAVWFSLVAAGVSACAQEEGVAPVGPAAAQPDLAASEAPDPKTIEVLDRLEASGQRLTSFASGLAYTKTFAIDSDMHVKLGSLYYRAPDESGQPPTKRFGIHFREQVLDPAGVARVDAHNKSYIFDGEWLCEMMNDDRLAIRRQVVEPGKAFDPLRLGEGPFPIPLGQRKEEILARFKVSVREAGESLRADDPSAYPPMPPEMVGAQARFVEGCVQLLLIPREGHAQRSDYVEVRFWLAEAGDGILIPRMVRTVNRSHDVGVVQLHDAKVNEPGAIPESALSTFPPQGWTLREEPWRGQIGEEP